MDYLSNLTFDFDYGSFELLYDAVHTTPTPERQYRRGSPPLIEPFAFTTGGLGLRTFVSECVSLTAPPSWSFAGTLVQWIPTNQLLSLAGLGFEGLPIKTIPIPLNRMNFSVLEKVGGQTQFNFGFEPAPWLPEFQFRLWRWNGLEREETLEEIAELRSIVRDAQETLEEIKNQTDKIP